VLGSLHTFGVWNCCYPVALAQEAKIPQFDVLFNKPNGESFSPCDKPFPYKCHLKI